MKLIPLILEVSGEPVIFYELHGERSLVDVDRIGVLSIRGQISRQIKLNYYGDLGVKKISDIQSQGMTELEAAVDELISRDEPERKIKAYEDFDPVVLGSFDQNDEAIAYSLLCFGNKILRVRGRELELNYIGNIEASDYLGFSINREMDMDVKRDLENALERLKRELLIEERKRLRRMGR